MHKFAEKVVKFRKLILILAVVLLVPTFIGFVSTPVNYDVLSYLPESMDTVKGQDIFSDEFGKGAFAMVVVDNMEFKDVAKLKQKLEDVDHVSEIVWYDTLADISIPPEILPKDIHDTFINGKTTLMAVFFDTTISEEATLDSIDEMRAICGKQAFISGMSAFILDLKHIIENEEPIYILIAVVLALILLSIFMDSFAIGVIFLMGIGMSIIYNMGTNFLLGDVSYITFAIAAVLQLAVTMDYSIFLWHSYEEQRKLGLERDKAMVEAVSKTLVSIIGSSLTTFAGFLALCFMTFKLGFNLGIVMAKGVLFGVIGSVTILPSLILAFEKIIDKTRHKPLNIKFEKITGVILKKPIVFVAIFVILLGPALYGYTHTEVYYKLDEGVPDTLPFAVASEKLSDEFGVKSTHILILDNEPSQKDITNMLDEMEEVEGVKTVLGLERIIGSTVPEEIIPDSISSELKSDKHKVVMITSDYGTASDEVNNQISELNKIAKKYDKGALLIGEAPATKDLIKITDRDFAVVTAISVAVVFLIIALVLKSISLPIILIACIELAIFINLGIPCYTGKLLSFIDSICISTIQLGATVDYAILMTTKYKEGRISGMNRRDAVWNAHRSSAPSILVSALSFFVATVGVSIYSNVDLISSMIGLMSSGAIISMLVVLFILPAFLYVFDKIIIRTTKGMKSCIKD